MEILNQSCSYARLTTSTTFEFPNFMGDLYGVYINGSDREIGLINPSTVMCNDYISRFIPIAFLETLLQNEQWTESRVLEHLEYILSQKTEREIIEMLEKN